MDGIPSLSQQQSLAAAALRVPRPHETSCWDFRRPDDILGMTRLSRKSLVSK